MKTASRIKLAATVASVVRASTRPGSPSLTERAQAVPRLVRATVERRYAGVTLGKLGLVAGAVAYVVSPVDLIPEALLPVLGAADDAVVITWAIKVFFEETDRFIAWEIGQGLHRPSVSTRRGLAAWSRYASPSGSEASSATVPGAATGPAVPRRDRDFTGAATPGGAEGAGTRGSAGARGARPGAGRTDAGAGRGSSGTTGATAGAGASGGRSARTRMPEGMRGAATDYVMESVRKRLER
ncbi:YkvA family protein [Monashia sp. NPDC004114]